MDDTEFEKKINKLLNYKHFKMEFINVINLIKPNV